MPRMTYASGGLICAALLVAGCTTALPWQNPGRNATAGGGAPMGATASTNSANEFRLQLPSPGQPAAAAASRSDPSTFTGALTSARDKFVSAFEIKPKVIEAPDPSKLSSQPQRLDPALYVRAAQWSESQNAALTAKQQYEKALELDPNSVTALVGYARFHDRQGHPDESLRLYERARQIAPQNAMVWNDLGLLHVRRGNVSAALDALQRAVSLDAKNPRYRNNLAATWIEAQRPAEALAVLRGFYPEANALFNVGYLLYLKQDLTQAADYLQAARAADPTLVAAQHMLQQMQLSGGPLSAPGRPGQPSVYTAARSETRDGPADATPIRMPALDSVPLRKLPPAD
jgi:tetratricopeptide (TPR) repeat protein